MKIGIISDIHRKTQYLDIVLNKLKQLDIQYLICAGDIVEQKHLQKIADFGISYVCVFGNNDYLLANVSHLYNIYKEPYYFKIANYSFKLMHIPFYMSGDTDIVIFGHTHKFEVSFINDTLFINPGEVCAREKSLIEFALLTIQDNYNVQYFSTNPTKLSWHIQTFQYKKGKKSK